MSKLHLLPLQTALSFLKVTKSELQNQTKLSQEAVSLLQEKGVTLDKAEVIATAYGYHPSEIWGDRWVDAVLTMQDWREYEAE